jgi:murein DD-endopeptidase MepM/ murein hydrolase activator NlpD
VIVIGLAIVSFCLRHWKFVTGLLVLSFAWGECHTLVLEFVGAPTAVAAGAPGDPFAGACQPAVTQPYGPTTFPGEPIVNGVRTHTGIDLACPAGTPVHTIGTGVAHVGFDSGFGNSVVVEGGGYFVRYAHLSAAAVQNGAGVRAGDLIGWEGSTGYSTGPHLHFEVDRGAPSVQRSIDPRPFLAVA